MEIAYVTRLKCVIFVLSLFLSAIADEPYYGMCANDICSVPIGKGTTTMKYPFRDDHKLSFNADDEVVIYVKAYGPKRDLWGVMLNGYRGYISKSFIKEISSYVKELVPAAVEFKTLPENSFFHNPVQASSYLPSQNMLINQDLSSMSDTSHTGATSIGQNEATSQDAHLSRSYNQFSGTIQPEVRGQEQSYSGLHSEDIPLNQDFHLFPGSFNMPEAMGQDFSNPEFFSGYSSVEGSESKNFEAVSHHSSAIDMNPHLHPEAVNTAQSLNIPEESSHVSLQSGNGLVSASHIPNIAETGTHLQESIHAFESQHLFESGISMNNPQINKEIFHSSDFQSKVLLPSHTPLEEEVPHSSIHSGHLSGPNIATEPILENHHKTVFSDSTMDQDAAISETLAMLRNRGVEDAEISANDYSSQSNLKDFPSDITPNGIAEQSLKHGEFSNINLLSSHSGYNPVENSDNHRSSNDLKSSLQPSTPRVSETTFERASHADLPESSMVNSEPSAAKAEPSPSVERRKYIPLEMAHSINADKSLSITEKMKMIFDTVADEEDESEDQESDEEEEVEISEDEEEEEIYFSEDIAKSSAGLDLQDSQKMNVPNSHVVETAKAVLEPEIQENNLKPSVEPSTPVQQESVVLELNYGIPSGNDLEKRSEMNIVQSSNMHESHSETEASEDVTKVLSEKSVQESSFPQVVNTVIDNIEHVHSNISNNNLFESENIAKQNEKEILSQVTFTNGEIKNFQPETYLFNSTKDMPDNVNDTVVILTKEHNSDLDKILNIPDLGNTENNDHLNSYQVRNLKGEHLINDNQNVEGEAENEENATHHQTTLYDSFENGLDALRSFLEALILWIPDPLYSAIMQLDRKCMQLRVIVFTAVTAIPCILLIVTLVYIKQKSKENKLLAKLVVVEKNAYTLSAEKNVLEEKLENARTEVIALKIMVEEENNATDKLKAELEHSQECLQKTNEELESSFALQDSLKQKEKEMISLLSYYEKERELESAQKDELIKELKEKEDSISACTDLLQEGEKELLELHKEKEEFLQAKEDYEEKLSLLQQNCNQLLQEAEVWNARVSELTGKLDSEISLKEELENSVKVKDDEIQSLKQLVQTFQSFEEVKNSKEEENKTNEEKLQSLMSASSVLIKLEKEQEQRKVLQEKLAEEKNKILDMEVEMLDAKSEIDKLKLSYNQALQDKAEAQTKLDVLTNYFKDKELQLQKQLGAQEVVRQKKEKDVTSAERRICLIEQENASYKCQVASMKQEMEETERNLKSQIALQEKKAHENWIAARVAERKLEDMKQEVTQLHQRLTLLEREQENIVNSSRDDIIRPVPKRAPGPDNDSDSQDINNTMEPRPNMFPPRFHERMPLPMMLPPDRPLPPLPPPPLHPFLPPLEPHFRPQRWHLPPDPMPSEFRVTPPEFMRGRESTPPRGRQSAVNDSDVGPHASSPIGSDMRDSRISTPPQTLPDFHDIPPKPRGPFYGAPARFPLPPPFRREFPKPPDNLPPRGMQQSSVPQERWQHSNSRV